MEEDTFLELLAIRSGDMHLDLDPGASWMARLSSRLYSGGIDPRLLTERFERQAADKGSHRHIRERKSLETQRRRLESELASRNARRAALVQRQEDAAHRVGKLEQRRAVLEKAKDRLGNLESERRAIQLSLERRRLQDILRKISAADKRRARIAALMPYQHSQIKELDLLEAQADRHARRIVELERDEINMASRLDETQRRVDRLAGDSPARVTLSRLASDLLEQLCRSAPGETPGTRRSWRLRLLSGAVVTVAAGAAACGLLNDLAFRVLAGLLALPLAALLIWLARPGSAAPDRRCDQTARQGADVNALKQEFTRRAPGEARLQSDDLYGLSLELNAIRGETQGGDRDLEIHRETLREKARLLHNHRQEVRTAAQTLEQARARAATWLMEHGVADRDALIEKAGELRQLSGRKRDWETEAAELMGQDFANIEQLKQACEHRLAELDRQRPCPSAATQGQWHGLDNHILVERKNIQAQESKLNRLALAVERGKGRMAGITSGLPEEIADLARRIARTAAAIETLNVDREAAALAGDIFRQISREYDKDLQDLALEVQTRFSGIMPELREISLKGLDRDGLAASDVEGTLRPVAHLSMGTRDAFLLAARLVLAARAGPKPAILVLDEPFLNLDAGRTARALAMIVRMQQAADWQIIMLSKDETLQKQVSTTFPYVTVHRLG